MKPGLKNFLVIVLKIAVGSVLTNAALMAMLSGAFNIHTVDGWWNLGKLSLAVIIGGEGKVWLPKLAAWSTSGLSNGNSIT